jgi:hypothetical protein
MVDFVVLFVQCAHQFHSFFHMCAAILCCLLPLSFHLYPMPPFCTAQGTRAVIFTLSPLGGIDLVGNVSFFRCKMHHTSPEKVNNLHRSTKLD